MTPLTPERIEQALRDRVPAVSFERQDGEAVREHILYRAGRVAGRDRARFLRDDPALDFAMLSWIAGVDYLPREPRFEVVYGLLSLTHATRFTLKVRVPRSTRACRPWSACGPPPTGTSARPTTSTASTFTGHPDLTRILLPDDWVGWPLRKDSPLGYEEVAFTHNTPRRTVPTPDLKTLKPKKVRYRAH